MFNMNQPQQSQYPIFSPQNPPPVNIQSPFIDLQGAVTTFSSTVANLAASTANNSVARNYTYQTLSQNNFQNIEFVQTVIAALEIFKNDQIRNRLTGNNQSDVYKACDLALNIKAALFVSQNQQLASSLPHSAIQSVQEVIQFAERLQMEIRDTVSMLSNPGIGQHTNMVNNAGLYNRNFNQMNSGVENTRSYASNPPVFVNRNNISTNQTTGDDSGRYHVQQTNPVIKTPVTEEVKKEPPLKWKPSRLQPHQLAYDHKTHTVVLEETFCDGVVVVIERLIEMDRKAHQTNVLVNEDKLQTVSSIVQLDKEKTIGEKTVTTPPVPKSTVSTLLDKSGFTKQPLSILDNGQILWDEGSALSFCISRAKAAHKSMPNSANQMYRGYYLTVKIFSCVDSLDEVINAFKTPSYVKLAKTLSSIYEKSSDSVKKVILELDKYLTLCFNDLIKNGFSLKNYWIESFVDDVEEFVGPFLNKRVGGYVTHKFLEYQGQFFCKYLTPCNDQDLCEHLKESYVNPELVEDPKKLNFIILEQCYSITSVDLSTKKLGINLQDLDTAKSTDNLDDGFIFFKDYLLNNKHGQGIVFTSHLLLVNDGRILTFNESPMGTGSLLVREFDSRFLFT